jgi:hypothetical protein
MFRLPLNFIAIFLSLLTTVGFSETRAGLVPQGCQPLRQPCYGPNFSCGPATISATSNATQNSRLFPESVYDGPCTPKLVPVTYREEGPVRSIVVNAVGLLKSTIQLPFKTIEAIFPVSWSQQQAGVPNYNGPQAPCPGNPVRLRRLQHPPIPACGFQPAVCAPPSPALGPIPSQATTPGCGPQLPPQLVQESRYPVVEPANLLEGLLNVPKTIVQSGRWFGDLFSGGSGAPYPYGQERP